MSNTEFLDHMLEDGYVYLDDKSRPYFAFKGTLYYWQDGNKKWVSLRQLAYGEYFRVKPRAMPDEEAKLYHELHVATMLVTDE